MNGAGQLTTFIGGIPRSLISFIGVDVCTLQPFLVFGCVEDVDLVDLPLIRLALFLDCVYAPVIATAGASTCASVWASIEGC
jgi:hypothetical protein